MSTNISKRKTFSILTLPKSLQNNEGETTYKNYCCFNATLNFNKMFVILLSLLRLDSTKYKVGPLALSQRQDKQSSDR